MLSDILSGVSIHIHNKGISLIFFYYLPFLVSCFLTEHVDCMDSTSSGVPHLSQDSIIIFIIYW